MQDLKLRALALQLLFVLACSPTPPGQPGPTGGERNQPAAAPKPATAPAPAPGAPPGTPTNQGPPGQRRRQPQNPIVQDSIRRATVDSILKKIVGRELEPAGKVFKNVVLLKDTPARDFLRKMDVDYGRALGWTCSNCHVVGQFDTDKKNKRIARQMQVLTNYINGTELPKITELDKEYEQVSCAMCHRGTNEPKGTIPVSTGPMPISPR